MYKQSNAIGQMATQMGGFMLGNMALNKVFGPGSIYSSMGSYLLSNGAPKLTMPKIPQMRGPKPPGITTAMNVDQDKLNENINSLYKISEARLPLEPQPRRKGMEKISAYDVKVVNDVINNLTSRNGFVKTAAAGNDYNLNDRLIQDTVNNLVLKPAGNAISDFISYIGNRLKPRSPLEQLAESPLARAAVPLAGLAALTGVGVAAANSLVDRGADAVKKNTSYKQMFEEFPELAEMPRTQVDKYWKVLDDFAPKLTTNPLVAGQFISNMASYGMRGIDHNVVGQLAKIENDLVSDRSGMEQALVKNISNKAYESMLDSQFE